MLIRRLIANLKIKNAALGLMLGAVLWLAWTSLTDGMCPRLRLEMLPVAEWGFGGLPPGTAYYFNPGYTCVFFYGDSSRLGVVRVITHIKEGSSLTIPPVKSPLSAR